MKVLKLISLFLFIFTIKPNAQNFNLTIAFSRPTCQSSYKDGRAYATAPGGPYTYLWNNGMTTQSISGLSAGKYAVSVTDSKGGTEIASIDLTNEESSWIPLTQKTHKSSCSGNPTGSIELIEQSNSNGPLKYQWNDPNNSTTNKITGLLAGIYKVTLTDKLGCIGFWSINLPKGLEILETTSGGNSCAEIGEININEVKGGAAPYSYLWENGSSGSKINNLKSGTYRVTVTDKSGCSDSKEISFNKTPIFILSSGVFSSACNKTEGEIETEIYNDSKLNNINYLWSSGQKTPTIDKLKPGIYTLTVTSDNCIATQEFKINGNIEIELMRNMPCGEKSGTFLADVINGGAAPYTYEWNNGEKQKQINVDNQVNFYSLTVTDANGCKNTAFANTRFTNSLSFSIYLDNTSYCKDLLPNIYNGVSPYKYQWSNGATSNKLEFPTLSKDNYSLTITDANGCSGVSEIYLHGSQLSPLNYLKRKICGNGVEYKDKCNNPNIQFKWDNGATTSVVTGLSKGIHLVTITDVLRNISSIDTFTIKSDSICFKVGLANNNVSNTKVKVFPNPAYDDINFFTEAIENQKLTLKIYNKSGQVIYTESSDKQQFYYNCSALPNGMYFYKINDINGNSTNGKFLVIK